MATFIIDWPVLMLFGLGFGAFAPRDRWWRSRAFGAGVATSIAFTLVAMLSYAIAPDWMWMYFLEPSDAAWAVPLIPIGYLFVYAISFAAGVSLAQVSRRVAWACALAAAVMEVVVVGLTWDRYHLVGTASQWSKGLANELFTASPSGDAKTIGLLSPLFVVVLIAAVVIVWRDARASAADR